MSISYENQREHFEIIVQKYLDYVALYKLFNSGSAEGVTNFSEFYWRMTYYSNYQNGQKVSTQGY